MKRGKKYIEAAKLIERGNLYDPAEAVALSAEDFSENNAECTETSNDGTTAVYACKAKGF